MNSATSWLNGGGFDDSYGGSEDFNAAATQNDMQTAGISGISGTGSNLQSLYNDAGISSLGRYLGDYDPNNTGLTGAIDAANNQLDWNYNTSVAPSIRQGATNAGQYGSTRAGVAEGIAQSQLSQQKTNAASTLAYQDQQAYNQNQLSALSNLSNITSGLTSGSAAQYDAGTLQQQQDQSQIDAQLAKWVYENNGSLNDLLAYQQLISGDYGGTTSGTSTSKTSGGGSSGLGALGSIGGAVLGGMYGGPAGAMAGSQVGGSLLG